MRNVALKNPGRRKLLRDLPVAAAASLAFIDASFFTASAAAQPSSAGASRFTLFTAQEIRDDIKALQANPGNKSLIDSKPFTMVLTTETAKSAREFEWHEGRDHIFQIIAGETAYELGGTPKGAHSKGPGEWLAPESEGATSVTVKQGDILVVPRGTPHKRTTAESVTLLLISPQGS